MVLSPDASDEDSIGKLQETAEKKEEKTDGDLTAPQDEKATICR
jgi:hypothetical protein